jgi:hypothetical protein
LDRVGDDLSLLRARRAAARIRDGIVREVDRAGDVLCAAVLQQAAATGVTVTVAGAGRALLKYGDACRRARCRGGNVDGGATADCWRPRVAGAVREHDRDAAREVTDACRADRRRRRRARRRQQDAAAVHRQVRAAVEDIDAVAQHQRRAGIQLHIARNGAGAAGAGRLQDRALGARKMQAAVAVRAPAAASRA